MHSSIKILTKNNFQKIKSSNTLSIQTTLMMLSTIEENFVILYVYDWHLNHQFWPDLGGDPTYLPRKVHVTVQVQ